MSTLSIQVRWRFPVVCLLAVVTSIYSLLATTLAAQSPTPHDTTSAHAPDLPNRPDLVTAVPFEWESAQEEGSLPMIKAEIDGHLGIYSFDTGSPALSLSAAFFKSTPANMVDTVGNTVRAHVQVRIGTMRLNPFDDSALGSTPAHPVNAEIDNFDKSDCCANGPLVGNIGLNVLEQFETIIDYTHHRVVLIRLDTAGHRLVEVPAYTPTWSAPLIDMQEAGPGNPVLAHMNHHWGVQAQLQGVTTTWGLDTGTGAVIVGTDTYQVPNGSLETDSLLIAGRPFHVTVIKPQAFPYNVDILGDTFLRPLGVVGFNHRTHQFIVYR